LDVALTDCLLVHCNFARFL